MECKIKSEPHYKLRTFKLFYTMRHSQSKKFSSLIGPATIPSGGFKVSSETIKYTITIVLITYIKKFAWGPCTNKNTHKNNTDVCTQPLNDEEQIQPFFKTTVY